MRAVSVPPRAAALSLPDKLFTIHVLELYRPTL